MRATRIAKLVAVAGFVASTAAVTAAETGKGEPMEQEAQGSFEVKVVPAAEEKFSDGTSLGRYTLAKELRGDLERDIGDVAIAFG